MRNILKIAALSCILAPLSANSAGADFLDSNVSHRPNRINPFIAPQTVKLPAAHQPPSRKMQFLQKPNSGSRDSAVRGSEVHKMRPGRNNDNPASNRFGDGSLPNKYIWSGSKNGKTQ